jgi:plasmid segregation protein ParM
MVGLTDGMPDKDTMLSREMGMSKLRGQIIDDVINDYGVTLDTKTVDGYLKDKRLPLPDDIKEQVENRIEQTTAEFTTELINQLHTKVADFRVYPSIFLGGGSMVLKEYIEKSKMFGITHYIDSISANAIGYEKIAEALVK